MSVRLFTNKSKNHRKSLHNTPFISIQQVIPDLWKSPEVLVVLYIYMPVRTVLCRNVSFWDVVRGRLWVFVAFVWIFNPPLTEKQKINSGLKRCCNTPMCSPRYDRISVLTDWKITPFFYSTRKSQENPTKAASTDCNSYNNSDLVVCFL